LPAARARTIAGILTNFNRGNLTPSPA